MCKLTITSSENTHQDSHAVTFSPVGGGVPDINEHSRSLESQRSHRSPSPRGTHLTKMLIWTDRAVMISLAECDRQGGRPDVSTHPSW